MTLDEWCLDFAKTHPDHDPKVSRIVPLLKAEYTHYIEINTKEHDPVEVARWAFDTFDTSDFVEVWSKYFFKNEPDAVQFKLTWY